MGVKEDVMLGLELFQRRVLLLGADWGLVQYRERVQETTTADQTSVIWFLT